MKKYLVLFIVLSGFFSGYSKNQKLETKPEIKKEVKQEVKQDKTPKQTSDFYMPRAGVETKTSSKAKAIVKSTTSTKDVKTLSSEAKLSSLASQIKSLLSSKSKLARENRRLREELNNMKLDGNVKIYCRTLDLNDIKTIELNYQDSYEFKKKITLNNGEVKEQIVKGYGIRTSCEYEKRHY